MKVWSDHQNTVAMARAFAGHSQIVSTILHNNGDNDYLSDRGGMSFGIRRTFVVVPITLAPRCIGETMLDAITNEASA